jgi:outer membrane protein assembly factor BamB
MAFNTVGSGASRYPVWETTVDNPVQYGVTYADGVVYGGGADLYALDASDGSQIWRYSAPTGIISQPTVEGDKVYIGSRDKTVYAINIADGTIAWSYTTGGFVLARPVISDDIVYVPSYDDYLYALNAEDGSLIWSYDTGADSDSVAVDNGIVYVGARDAHIYALNADDGSILWEYRTADDGSYILSTETLGSPTVVDDIVYIGGITYASSTYNYYIYAFDADDGAKLWATSVDSKIRAAPLVEGGIAYFVTDAGYTYAVDATTGIEMWHRVPTADSHSGVSTPALYDGVLYVGTSETHLQALDADDGSRLWYGLTNSYVRDQIYVSS